MSLSCRQQHRLGLIKAGLRRSDPLLSAMFGMFGRLYKGEGMPAWEQVPTRQDGRRIVAWGAALLSGLAVVFSAVLTAALVAVTAMRHPRGRPPASMRDRASYGREAGDHQGPPRRG
jgi:Protein of unknown function (DUF3040)